MWLNQWLGSSFFLWHLIAFDFFMTCSNFKPTTSNSRCENWTWGLWELKTVQSEQPEGKEPTMELFAWESNSSLGCHIHKLHLFLKVMDRKRGLKLKDGEQPQLSAINFHLTTKSYTLSTRQQLRNPLTAKTPTQMFVPFWANPVSSGEVSYTGNGNLQWLRTPWVTATIFSWGEMGLKLQQDQREKGLCPSERIYSLLTSPLPKSVTPKSPQSFLVSVNSDSHSTDICA